MSALARGTETRVWRAAHRVEIAGGNTQLACELLLQGDARLKTLEIGDFLEWLPRVGPHRARRIIINKAFRWPTDRTPHRQIGGLDLETCMRIAATIRSIYAEVEDVAA